MVNCIVCGSRDPVAVGFISRLALGNEEIYSLFKCPSCTQYFIEGYEDIFISLNGQDDITWTQGPYDEKKGALLANLIKQCPDPGNKFCECPAHVRFFKEI
nr:hypothetical protein [Candidatus Sigynarchaeota archaeon]